MSDPGAEVADKLRQFGESYLGVAGEFWRVLERAQASPPMPGAGVAEELERLRRTLTGGLFGGPWGSPVGGQAQSGGLGGLGGFGIPGFGAPGWPGFGAPAGAQLPGAELLELWQRLGAGLQSPPFAGSMPPSWPAFGLTRERQEALQRLQAAAAAYQQELARLAQLWSSLISRAVDLLTERIRARLAAGENYESLRAVYDSWIDCAEEAYAEKARSSEFSQLQAALCNAMTAVRSEQQAISERLARDLDLPSRAELNSVHRSLKNLRKEIAALRREREAPPPAPARRRRPPAK